CLGAIAPFAPAQNSAKTPASSADDGEWRTPAKDDANTRFSPLGQITTSNVAQLKSSFSFSTGVLRGHESAPLVIGSRMYIVTPYPNLLYALDLKQAGGPAAWKYQPHPASAAQGVACCDVVNRGATYADGRIFFNTLDGYAVAVDAATGQERWKVKLADFNIGESITMAPFVVK